MSRYVRKEIGQLAHQLTLSPLRLREKQLAAAERLVALIEPAKSYPYDFVCFQITGYRKANAAMSTALRGADLLHDLSQLADDLSKTSPEPANDKVVGVPELAEKLNVSTKTITRWRARGLLGRRYRFADGKVAIGFASKTVQQFVDRNQELVSRASAFRQLTDEERKQIVARARTVLAQRRVRLHELAQQLSAETGRAVETIRYTLRQFDRNCPEQALFAVDETPQVPAEYQAIYSAWQRGDSPRDLARQFRKSAKAVGEIVREMRCRRLLQLDLAYIYSPEFDDPAAEQRILGEDLLGGIRYQPARAASRTDIQPYLNDLSRLPVLSREQEAALFRQYNYLKFRAKELLEGFDPVSAAEQRIVRAEALVARAEAIKAAIIQCNLRLVVSIAKRHVRGGENLFEIVSDGNIALMRAVEKFDYTRGNKFSTYATWAIVRNYARTMNETRGKGREYQSAAEEMLEAVADPNAGDGSQWEQDSLRERLADALSFLNDRERVVVCRHFGLGGAAATHTLEEIGAQVGVTKERVRQIEKRALARLREALPESMLDLVSG